MNRLPQSAELTVEIIATGPGGQSAYAAAAAQGYTGSEAEFGEALAASAGTPVICPYPDSAFFPDEGSENRLYLDTHANACYRWDPASQTYRAVGADYSAITLLCSGGADMQ